MAHNLIGFQSSSLRVQLIREIEGSNCVIVCTADTQDEGTNLVIHRSQLQSFDEYVHYPVDVHNQL